ncbi:ribonuclease III [Corynespora cassiicola Philippines]|uniref:Ribonuclease III n=1 Tax=Corynespora cassiicola Philippines TaxID=1448308 RepID=A0A2T2P1V4_CORCC|nr:ribonuclease III [Corynespora cassiicola Philippines]
MPDPRRCEPCKLHAVEMQSAAIAMLDKLAAEECSPDGDRDILKHARELHKLLSSRARKSLPSESLRQLDERRPEKEERISIPTYALEKIQIAKDLPPLPTIDEKYYQEAVFTHRSFNSDVNAKGLNADDSMNYERLEFLGDAYIEMIATRVLFSRFPTNEVPSLCTLREQLVKNETLSRFSHAYNLPDRLKHGGHIKESKAWTKICADIFEAYVAAIVLSDPENGYEIAEKWLTELWSKIILDYKEQVVQDPRARDQIGTDLVMKGVKLDYIQERDMVMEEGVQKFFMGVYLTGWGYEQEWLGSGVGQSKAVACVAAANDAIQKKSPAYQNAKAQKDAMREAKLQEKANKFAAKEKQDGANPEVQPGEEKQPEECHDDSNDKKKKKKKRSKDKDKLEAQPENEGS